MSNPNLNQKIENLLTTVKEQVAQNTNPDFTFGAALVESAEKVQAKVQLSEEEQKISEITENKSDLNENIYDFIERFGKAYFINKGETPDWLKLNRHKTLLTFFASFFETVDSLDAEFLKWFDEGSQVKLSDGKAFYTKRKAIDEQEKHQTSLTQKVQQALDLKALLIGALRMFGLSGFEIRVIQQGG